VVHELLLKFLLELIQGGSSGLSQLDVDRVSVRLERARQRFAGDIGRYRDDLDRMKVAFGLSPHAPIIADRRILAGFDAAFEGVENWLRKPNRDLGELHVLVDRAPVLGDVVVGERPIARAVEGNPNAIDDLLNAAAREAIKNRSARNGGQAQGDSEVQLELSVRRRIRHLFEIQAAYVSEKRSYERAIRVKDQSFERLFAPATGVTVRRTPLLGELLDHLAEARKAEVRLVRLWTEFRAERLALYREIGTLPYKDWNSLYENLTAAGAVPAEGAPAPANLPAPGANRQPSPPAAEADPQPTPPTPGADRQPSPPAPGPNPATPPPPGPKSGKSDSA